MKHTITEEHLCIVKFDKVLAQERGRWEAKWLTVHIYFGRETKGKIGDII